MDLVHEIFQARRPFPSPGDLPNPGIEPRSPTLQADSLPTEPQGKPGWPGKSPKLLRSKKLIKVQFSCSVMSNSLPPHGLQHTSPPCPSATPRVYPNSCPLSWWCHPTISSSFVPFSFNLSQHQGLFKWVKWVFSAGGWSIRDSASASVLPMNTQDWFPLFYFFFFLFFFFNFKIFNSYMHSQTWTPLPPPSP